MGMFQRLSLLVTVLATFVATTAAAQVRIDINRGKVEPMPIAVPGFLGRSDLEKSLGADIAAVISNDLERSGLFAPINKAAFIEQLTSMNVQPRFADWRPLGAQVLVQGEVTSNPDGSLRVAFRLWDVFGAQQMLGQAFSSTPDKSRRVAHIIADAIYQRITGEQGYFDTRVVYIAESGPKDRRVKRLAIMDQDGANHLYLTDGKNMVLTPRFSPTAQEITYLQYYESGTTRLARVLLTNIEAGRTEMLGDFPGIQYAPRFSPDGNKVIMSMARDGNSEIYTIDLRTRQERRLTNHPAIDTSPSFAPDGRFITFTSDRGKGQQIYVMNADGSDAHRISFGQGWYATPVWSPRGDLIAFTRGWQGKRYIGVMKPDGTGERLLDESFQVEGPTWAPNGRVLKYWTQSPTNRDGSGGRTRLMSIDLTGYNKRVVLTPQDASDPAWSPLLPHGRP